MLSPEIENIVKVNPFEPDWAKNVIYAKNPKWVTYPPHKEKLNITGFSQATYLRAQEKHQPTSSTRRILQTFCTEFARNQRT
jgi:hypothetical protein